MQPAQPEYSQCHDAGAESELLQQADVGVWTRAMDEDRMRKVGGPENEQEEEEGVFPAAEREGKVLTAEGGLEDEKIEVDLLWGGGSSVEGVCGRGGSALWRRGGVVVVGGGSKCGGGG